MSGPDLHVFTLKFLALKKTGFSPIKNTFQKFFDFCLPLCYATFQCGPYNILKKIYIIFLPLKILKNGPKKWLIIGPNLFLHWPAQPTAQSPELFFHAIDMSQDTSASLSVVSPTYLPKF